MSKGKSINISEMLKGLFGELRAANPQLSETIFQSIQNQVTKGVEQEPPPRIAVIGETGVGKSSTLNALFNAGQEVSHTRAQTQEAVPIEIQISNVEGENGVLIVYDMPGLGESVAKSRQHRATYAKILKNVDVAVWILDAQDRAMESVQRYITRQLRTINPELVERVIFALNKVDLVAPGQTAWHPLANLPSEAQELNIKERVADVRSKIMEVMPEWQGTVIGYSAEKRYNLPQLFAVMLDAVPKKRRWVLASRKAIADFLELVDPRLIPEDKRPLDSHMIPQQARPVVANREQQRIARALDEMTDEAIAQIPRTREELKAMLNRMLRDE